MTLPGDPLSGRHEADALVVGAGLAGLVAARSIAAAGREVLVLEARDRVGGRLHDHPVADGRVVELGGEFIGPTQRRIASLAGELGCRTFPTYTDGERMLAFGGRVIRYSGETPSLPGAVRADLAQAAWRLTRMAADVAAEAPWEARKAQRRDSVTMERWIARNARSCSGRSLLTLAVRALCSLEPADVSLLHFLFLMRSGQGFDRLLQTDGGAQERRFVTGPQALAARMAERLGDRVRLSSPVVGLRQDGGCVEAHGAGFSVRARRAIVAMHPALAGRLVYEPRVDGPREQLFTAVLPGAVIKAMAIYEEPFWRTRGLAGQAQLADGPVSLVFDNSPPDGSPGVLLAFVEARHAQRLASAGVADRRRVVTAALASVVGEDAAHPAGYVEGVWPGDPWTRGCSGHLRPGGWSRCGAVLRRPAGRVHWAGSETAAIWNGYMDGAVGSGRRAAHEVLEALERR